MKCIKCGQTRCVKGGKTFTKNPSQLYQCCNCYHKGTVKKYEFLGLNPTEEYF